MALIYLAFSGIQPKDVQDYKSKYIWPYGEQFYSLMASRLNHSPLLKTHICVSQLEAMVHRLQALHPEEVHVALTRRQRICLDKDYSIEEYYRQAFLSLHLGLLPKIYQLLQEPVSTAEVTMCHLAHLYAEAFQKAPSVEALEGMFTSTPEILDSKPDI
ncbi:uncharacterized protein N7483_002385 [Penicillium malachiteum]|uniref:uncharacterized protein n=1 Tax=Penicillium malachiteum TaxID=1324776 RepID=UPI0025472369|nr:uncharacterized protein N7483_002385 [Penicillium malachiteum]KAJ5737260.1 hypothetical protein N7483_002385 [Penicillium malachiteum]